MCCPSDLDYCLVVPSNLDYCLVVASNLDYCLVVASNLDYCVVFVNRVDVFLEGVYRTLKASEDYARLPCRVSLFCLRFGSPNKHHNHCNINLKSESITGQFRNKAILLSNAFRKKYS